MKSIGNGIAYLSTLRWLRIIVGGLLGAGIGYLAMVMLRAGGTTQFIAAGTLVGLVVTAIFDRDYRSTQLTQLQLSIPQFSSMTFVVNAEYRRVAWRLFIETSTRISSQPLGPEEGYLREAFNSLYGIFNTTRELLKAMDPSPSRGGKSTVEMFAYDMLNKELRPFLSKWHPLLKAFEEKEPTKSESEWELNRECRQELEQLRKRLLRYVRGFGELAGVSNLDHFVPPSELE